MHTIIVAPGSYGDVHPFLGLGKSLRRRGHRVTLMASGYFASHTERAGLEFVEIEPTEDYLKRSGNRDVMDRQKYPRLAVRYTVKLMPVVYQAIAERYVPGETVVAAPSWAFGARVAQEKLGVPLATVYLQPRYLRSVYDTPALSRYPVGVAKFVHNTVDRIADRLLGPGVNGFRAELGLPRAAKLIRTWWNSPEMVIGFYPDWFCRPQPDWPANTLLSGFPLYDEGDVIALDDELESFLSDGEPPLVFSHSSWMRYAHDYLRVAVEVAQQLNRRAILLSPYTEHIPANLPDGVRHFGMIPFSRVLPRTAAIVHHGGIGTIGLAMAAGIPQLTVPTAHDQPDNSRRLARLGVSALIPPRKFRTRFAARTLNELLVSPQVAENCKMYSQLCAESNSYNTVGSALERLCASSMEPCPV